MTDSPTLNLIEPKLAPLTMLCGCWGSLAATLAASAVSLGTNWLVTADERRELAAVARRYYDKLRRRRLPSPALTTSAD